MKLHPWFRAQARWAREPERKRRAGFWYTLLVYAILFVVSEILRPKPNIEDAKPAGLGDFQFPTATKDRVVPLLWGTIQCKGPNVVWYGDLRQVAITEKIKTGLFSSERVIKGYKYEVGVQFAMCRGPVDKMLRTWIGEDLVYDSVNGVDAEVEHLDDFTIDEPDLFGGDDLGNGGISGTLRFFEGNQTQGASSYLDDFQVEGNRTPAYRGTCYIAPTSEPTYIGNSSSIKPWSFELQRIPNGLALATPTVNTYDANPANVIYEILTDTEWGFGQAASKVNVDATAGSRGFEAVADVLTSEGNGFSMLLDRSMEASELLEIVEQQIGGKVYVNKTTGLWEIGLARADYDINTITVISESNAIEIVDFTRGAWDDTTNIVRTKFDDRENEYQTDFGLAQDSGNITLRGGDNVVTTVDCPGVKNATLANNVAWRILRTVSYPLAKAKFVMDRNFYDTNPVDVFAFTSSKFGTDKMPMRVTRVDLGDLENNQVVIDCVEDVFYNEAPSFGDPDGTGWVPPEDTLLPFITGEQVAFEAPRAFVIRNPTTTGVPTLVWAGARQRGNEVGFKLIERNAAGTPAGSYMEAAEAYQLLKIGELQNNVSPGQTSPVSTITITNAVDSQADLIAEFDEARDPQSSLPPTVEDLGQNLVNLVYVTDGTDGEFMLVTSAVANGMSNVDMEDVYRGVLDTVQGTWAAGSEVFLVFAGGNVSQYGFPETNNIHIKLLPFSATDEVLESSATLISLSLDRRVRRPYPPSRVSIGGTVWGSTVSLEQQTGSDDDDKGFAVDFLRRDYRSGNGLDEIGPLSTDAGSIFLDFPTANNTTTNMQLRDDPDGANTLLISDTGLTGTENDQNRTAVLHAAGGSLPTRLRVVLTAVHDEGGDTGLTARQNLTFDFDVTSELTGQFELGDLDTDVASNQYTVDAAGVHSFTIGTAIPTNGDVEYRVDTGGGFGAWTQLIAQGNTSGSTSSLSVSDILEVRHRSSDSGVLTHLQMTAPGAGTDAWGILFV